MSREQVFWLTAVVCLGIINPIVLAYQAARLSARAVERELDAVTSHLGPQTQNLAPIFRCNGAGGEVLVSLGGDGSSVFVSCAAVKP